MESLLPWVVMAALVGAALIVIGWRGRRVDKHPICARCGFDLFGGRRWESKECPECGANVAGLDIRVGNRARRVGALGSGIAILLPALLVIAAAVVIDVRRVNVARYKPAWMLVRDLKQGAAVESLALAELARRLRIGTLADGDVAAVAEHCLANQADPSLPWEPWWGAFLEAAGRMRKLSDGLWARYAAQSCNVTAYIPAISRDGRVSLVVQVAQSRHTAAPFVARIDLTEIRLDGQLVNLPADGIAAPRIWAIRRAGEALSVKGYEVELPAEQVRSLSKGLHRVSATALLAICEDHEFGPEVTTRRLNLQTTFNVPPAPSSKPASSASPHRPFLP